MSSEQLPNIDKTALVGHTHNVTLPLVEFDENEYFGIVKTTVAKTRLTKTPTFILFTIDKTGSMGEYQKMNTTKMMYVIQTFVNIIIYLSNLDAEIYVQVNTFNIEVDVLVPCMRVMKYNIDKINTLIRNITTDGSTDIGIALTEAYKVLAVYEHDNPFHQIAHIFMTDGEANIGIKNTCDLVDMVNDKYNNIFVGFGAQHNFELLSKMGAKKNAEYQFIDNMENTSLIYAETLHKFIYPALRKVEFRIENGELYDWQQNRWKDSIYEDILIGETEKIYHFKTNDPLNVRVTIYGILASLPIEYSDEKFDTEFRLLDTIITIPDLVDIESGEVIRDEIDLTKYAFRQKVQELLFKAKEVETDKRDLKVELKHAFRVIHKYMRIHDLLEDGLLKMLCDDICITHRTLGLRNGFMYSAARQTSQGRQRTYNTSSSDSSDDIHTHICLDDPDLYHGGRSPSFRHNNNNNRILNDIANDHENVKQETENTINYNENVFKNIFEDNIYFPEDEIETYMPSRIKTTCFASPKVLDTMRNISQQDI